MHTSLMSPVGPSRSYSTDKELVNDPGIESISNPVHFCRQCGTHWDVTEQSVASSEHFNAAKSNSTAAGEAVQRPRFRKRCIDRYHKHPWWHWIILSAIAFLAAIVVALAIHFRPKTPTGMYSNGTGLVVLDRGDNSTIIDVFFQHESGQLRHSVFDDRTKKWTNGLPEDNVLSMYAPSPRRGTPLMAVSYEIGDETTWRVFYVDTDDLLQESIASTTTDQFPSAWSTGTLGLGTFKAHPSTHTGLSVCRNMLWAPDASGLNNGSLVLFYGGADGTNHMLTHGVWDTAWKYNSTFQGSSAASGIECTSRGDEIVDSWMIDTEGRLLQASYNFDPGSNKTAYTAGRWQNGTIFDGPVRSPTSISAIKYTGGHTYYEPNSTFVYIVPSDNIITGFNVNTSNRSQVPATMIDTCTVSNLAIVSGSKFGTVSIRTNKIDPNTQAYGEDNKVILQPASNPTQMLVMSKNFGDDTSLFAPDGNVSSIRN